MPDDATKILEEHWAWLVPLRGVDAGKVIVVRPPLVIGSDPDAGLIIHGTDIAARHVEVTRGERSWEITANGRKGSTRLDGDALDGGPFELADNTRIEIGDLVLVFKCLERNSFS